MSDPVDPMSTAGRWLVTTASGARHVIESTGQDGGVTVTRITAGSRGDDPRYLLGSLRRDDEALAVLDFAHLEGGSWMDGIAVGEDMYLTLQPLDPRAYATVRRTTPVLSIEELREEVGDG